MKNKGYLFFALIFLVCILSISAVNAADDVSIDIDANDNQELILDESIDDVSANAEDDGELTLDENNEDGITSASDDNQVTSQKKNASSEKKKAATKKASKKTSKKAKNAVKESSKKKTTFKTISKDSKDKAMVKKIQKALKKNGYYLSYKGHYLMVDGWYGPCTFRSVKQFQKAKKLKVTGKVDEKTALKLKIIDYTNAKIKFENDKIFKGEYNSGKSFEAKIVNKKTGKGIKTALRVDYLKNGKKSGYDEEYYYTDENGINYITPDELGVGTYKAIVSCNEGKIKATPQTKTIIVSKTSIRLNAKDVTVSDNKNVELKASLKFKNNAEVNEGKVKFTIDGKSYVVKVKNGIAVKNLKLDNVKSNKYTVEFLGTKNIKGKSATGKIV